MPEPTDTPPEPPKVTFGARISAAYASIAGGESRILELTAEVTRLTQANAALESEKVTLAARVAALEAEQAEASAALEKVEKEAAELRTKEQSVAKRADAAAQEKVAALGFPASKLPAAKGGEEKDDVPTSREALEKRMNEAKTMQERHELLQSWKARQAKLAAR